jgi:multidrug efflux system membrane fusion protein
MRRGAARVLSGPKAVMMKPIPFLTALVVLGVFYMLVMERPALMALAGVEQAAVAPETEAETAVDVPQASLRVVVSRIAEREIEQAVVLRGRTEAARRVEVRAETSGLVASDPRPRGSTVAAGDLLCALDPGTRRAALAEAAARLAEAQINFTAASRLSEDGFAAQSRVAAAEAAVQAARAGVERAQTDLDRLDIRAPFAGVLEADTAERGALLSQGGLCGTVIALDPMRLVGFAAESQIDSLAVGAVAGGRLSSGREVVGRVTFLARVADPATRTFRVEVTVPNADLSIREGMSTDILVQAQSERAHLVPASALTLDDAGRLGLRLVNADGITEFAPVTVLRDSAQGFWVRGLPPEADVIVVGQEYVRDGVRVDSVMREPGE